MRTPAWWKLICWTAAAALLASFLFVAPGALIADESALVVEGSQPLHDNLKQKIGSKVTLRLTAGEEISGTVTQVGDNAVHLSALAGREFYDAVIRLDQVIAVLVRARDK